MISIKKFSGKAVMAVMLVILAISTTASVYVYAGVTSSAPKINNVLVSGKAFNDADCLKYLDRPIRAYGYQPVQIIIKNDSDKSLFFSPDQVSLPCARIENVVEEAHTSTVGRSVGYGAAAFFSCGLFVIPAIVDGVKSANANRALDSDYFAKTAKKTLIAPNTKMNSIIFVPSGSYTDSFQISLLEEGTNHRHEIPVRMY